LWPLWIVHGCQLVRTNHLASRAGSGLEVVETVAVEAVEAEEILDFICMNWRLGFGVVADELLGRRLPSRFGDRRQGCRRFVRFGITGGIP
jgi:hypothetical protein